MNNKAIKQEKVDAICQMYNASDYVFLFKYTGMNAEMVEKFRKSLFIKTGDKVSVIKNSLHKLATKSLNLECLSDDDFTGQVALICTNKPLSVASLVKKFIDSKAISLISYNDKKSRYTNNEFSVISAYENELSLKSQLVCMLSNSYASVVRIINGKSSIV